jgi:DNA repair protein RadC
MIDNSLKAYKLLKTHWDDGLMHFLEQFKVIPLNTANRALGIFEVSLGGINGVSVYQRIIFAAAIKSNPTRLYWLTSIRVVT